MSGMQVSGPEVSEEERALYAKLGALRLEHRDLDSAIDADEILKVLILNDLYQTFPLHGHASIQVYGIHRVYRISRVQPLRGRRS